MGLRLEKTTDPTALHGIAMAANSNHQILCSSYYVLATRLIKKEIQRKRRRRNSYSLSANSVPDIRIGTTLSHLVLTILYDKVGITMCMTIPKFQVKK